MWSSAAAAVSTGASGLWLRTALLRGASASHATILCNAVRRTMPQSPALTAALFQQQQQRTYAKASGPTKQSKKKRRLEDMRRQRLAEKEEAAAPPKVEVAIDFSPRAQRCNVMTALMREEIHHRSRARQIPEFGAGCTVAVTYTDALSKTNTQRSVGLVIAKRNKGLGSNFIIRNAENGIGYEHFFFTHSPMIKNIEVLDHARRRRAKLYYLRDRPAKDSYVSAAFEARPPPADGKLPVVRANRK